MPVLYILCLWVHELIIGIFMSLSWCHICSQTSVTLRTWRFWTSEMEVLWWITVWGLGSLFHVKSMPLSTSFLRTSATQLTRPWTSPLTNILWMSNQVRQIKKTLTLEMQTLYNVFRYLLTCHLYAAANHCVCMVVFVFRGTCRPMQVSGL